MAKPKFVSIREPHALTIKKVLEERVVANVATLERLQREGKPVEVRWIDAVEQVDLALIEMEEALRRMK